MTWQRVSMILMEMIICAVHPIPAEYYFTWTTKLANHAGRVESTEVSSSIVVKPPCLNSILPLFFHTCFMDTGADRRHTIAADVLSTLFDMQSDAAP